jgi:hypothetical protein
MNVYRNHLRGKSSRVNDDMLDHQKLILERGEVHEAFHWMSYKGDIDMSGLTFEAEPVTEEKQATSIQSFLDIVVFEVPKICTSESCDVSKYGVGKMDTYKNKAFVNHCEGGRLSIDSSLFHGFHTQLMVPSIGPMPRHVKQNKVPFPNKEQTYEVVFANCNDDGRKVLITGQTVIDYDENKTELSFVSVVFLTTVALSICLLFTFLTVRIRRGTLAEYNDQRLNTTRQ